MALQSAIVLITLVLIIRTYLYAAGKAQPCAQVCPPRRVQFDDETRRRSMSGLITG